MKTKVLQEQQTSQLQLGGTLSQVKCISISIATLCPFHVCLSKCLSEAPLWMVFLAHTWPKKTRKQKRFVAKQNLLVAQQHADKTGLSYKEVRDKWQIPVRYVRDILPALQVWDSSRASNFELIRMMEKHGLFRVWVNPPVN